MQDILLNYTKLRLNGMKTCLAIFFAGDLAAIFSYVPVISDLLAKSDPNFAL